MAIERILEPEVMESIEEAIAYDQMDHSEVNRCFVDDLLAVGDVRNEILDLGTGTALIPIELCARRDDLRVVAVDLSVGMLDVARNNIEIAGRTDRIRLDRIDAKELYFEDGEFSVVMSNSIVHHIPEPFTTLAEAVRVTSPGGLVFFRDLLRPDDRSTLDDLVRAYADKESEEARRMFCESLQAALTVDEMRQLVTSLGFDAATVQATSDRHWTWAARKG